MWASQGQLQEVLAYSYTINQLQHAATDDTNTEM